MGGHVTQQCVYIARTGIHCLAMDVVAVTAIIATVTRMTKGTTCGSDNSVSVRYSVVMMVSTGCSVVVSCFCKAVSLVCVCLCTVLVLLCIGPSQGNCQCGLNNNKECDCRCECLPGWEDSPGLHDCDCKSEVTNCVSATNTEDMCYGHGSCVCNTCECLPGFRDNDKCEVCPVSRSYYLSVVLSILIPIVLKVCDSLCQRTDDCVKQEVYSLSSELVCGYKYTTLGSYPDNPKYSISINLFGPVLFLV